MKQNNQPVQLPPKYYAYQGGFSNLTRCSECGSTGLYEDQHVVHCCVNCGGKVYQDCVGKWNIELKKWEIKK